MKTLLFAGAGSVGKTATLDALKKLAEANGLTVAIHKSSTRRSYAEAGIKSEDQALKDVEFNKKFQEKVLADNSADLLYAVASAQQQGKVDLFIADRTPYDYTSYYMTVFSDSLTVDIIQNKRTQAKEIVDNLKVYANDLIFIFFPFPAAWSKDTESSDGWRADKTSKNFLWSSVISNELTQSGIKRGYPTPDKNVEEVAEEIFDYVFGIEPKIIN